MGQKLNNLINTRFNNLVVTKLCESKQYGKSKKRLWECLCDCGKITFVTTGQLTSGKTKSCGCLHKISSVENSIKSRHKIVKKEAGYNSIYNHYKANAKKRNYEFNLTKQEFIELTQSNCFYCGIEPLSIYNKNFYNILYNGIDRIDNSKGYIIDNSVACCKMCNIAKNNNTLEYFMQWIKQVFKHNFKNI